MSRLSRIAGAAAVVLALTAMQPLWAQRPGVVLREAAGSKSRILNLHEKRTAQGMDIRVRLARGLRGHNYLGGDRMLVATALSADGKTIAVAQKRVSKRETFATLHFDGGDAARIASVTVTAEKAYP